MAASDFVESVSGPILPADAYHLAIELEDRGFTLARDGDSTLVITPPERLTPADCARIQRWKWHLLMLLNHDFNDNHLRDRPTPRLTRTA